MIRILAASLAVILAAAPAFACPLTQTSSTATPSTTAAAQPAPCPTCVVPDQGGAPQTVPGPQKPS